MKIAHVALWTTRLEELRDFYVHYFNGRSNEKYNNPSKGFESYFITFDSGCALELMRRTDISPRTTEMQTGFCHIAFGCSDRNEVLEYTERLRKEGYRILNEPRITGDGYFESVIADPDGNPIELAWKPES